MPFPRILSGIALLLLPFCARADWGIVGAATRCDATRGTFVIAPVVELSSEDKGAVPPEKGFSKVPHGTHDLTCPLESTTVVAKLRIYPSDAGACMGSGYVSIDSLEVGGRRLITTPTAFNWQCRDEEILIRLEVAVSGSGPSLTRCTAANWAWGIGFSGVHCSTTKVSPTPRPAPAASQHGHAGAAVETAPGPDPFA